jgi:hypothetical protein
MQPGEGISLTPPIFGVLSSTDPENIVGDERNGGVEKHRLLEHPEAVLLSLRIFPENTAIQRCGPGPEIRYSLR